MYLFICVFSKEITALVPEADLHLYHKKNNPQRKCNSKVLHEEKLTKLLYKLEYVLKLGKVTFSVCSVLKSCWPVAKRQHSLYGLGDKRHLKGGSASLTEFSQTGLIQLVLLTDISE